jgi:hypothetical protein
VLIGEAQAGSTAYLDSQSYHRAFIGAMPNTTVVHRTGTSVLLALTGNQPPAWLHSEG